MQAASRSKEVFELLSSRYPETQYRFVQFITDHLADCSRVFNGDLVQMMVLALVGQAFLNAHLARTVGEHSPPADWISATRIVDICGLSRETVRRKLKVLEGKQWIEQVAGGGWRIMATEVGGSQARIDLTELDRRGIERLANLLSAFEPILSKHR